MIDCRFTRYPSLMKALLENKPTIKQIDIVAFNKKAIEDIKRTGGHYTIGKPLHAILFGNK